MPCHSFKLPGGGSGILCTRGRKPPVCKCGSGERVAFECDYIVRRAIKPTSKNKTCDAKLCERCAYSPATDKHLCPKHKVLYAAWLKLKELREMQP
jgi:hypothetical protein